jgi:hypothetical protein
MTSPTGNKIHDAAVLAAEAVRQGVVNVAGVSQSTATASTVTFYRSVLASAATNGLDQGVFIQALQQLRVTP